MIVHVRVVDAATKLPTPVRIRFAVGDRYLSPLGLSADFPTGRGEGVGGQVYLGGKKYAYIDGVCEIEPPAGEPIEVEVTRGPAYHPLRQTITLKPGQLTLRLTIERAMETDQAIDMRCHFLPPHAARLEAAAEGLDLAQLLATPIDLPSQDGHLYRSVPNLVAFSGQAESVSGVRVNTLNVHPALGKLALLHSHRPIHPLTAGHVEETDDWSLLDWCDQCHRKGGLVVWCDATKPEAGLPGGEALVAAVLGKVDAIEYDGRSGSRAFLPYVYHLWNVGVRVALVGSSGKDSNRVALGGLRTYVLRELDWIDAVRQGRTTASSGPMLSCRVEDGIAVAEVPSLSPVNRVELFADGVRLAADSGRVVRHPLPESCGWVAAACFGVSPSPVSPEVMTFAHTSPIWVGEPRRPRATRDLLVRQIEGVRRWLEEEARFSKPQRRERRIASCEEAISALRA